MDYSTMNLQLSALIEGAPHPLANLANAAALLYTSLPDVSWAGFYLAEENEGHKLLVLGPFQGKPACIEIPWGRGVCGTAAAEKMTQLVPDVHAFPGHIACDAASRSEIVVPLFDAAGQVAGVMDLDSTSFGRFADEDRRGLEAFARILEKEVFGRA